MPRRSGSTPRTHRSRIIPIFGARTGQARKQLQPRHANFSGNNFMPQVPIIMPQLGESIAEATIVDIKVKPGDQVAVDQEIIDVETNKAVMGVTTPCKGKVDKITAKVKETYPIGTVLGYVEASEEDAAKFKKTAPEPPSQVAEEIRARADQESAPARREKVVARGSDGAAKPRTGGLPVPATLKGASFVSPRVRARMAELHLTHAGLARY